MFPMGTKKETWFFYSFAYPRRDNEGPMRVLDRKVKKLRNKEIMLMKIQWKHHDEGEASWELDSEMREKFPFLF